MNTEDPLDTAKALVATVPGWAGRDLKWQAGPVPIASPMYQGVDATAFRASNPTADESLWVKVAHADAKLFADPAAIVDAAKSASFLGIAPKLVASDPETGALAMQDLSDTHKTATLDRLAEPAISSAVIKAKRAFHNGPRLQRCNNVFDQIEALYDVAGQNGVVMPQDEFWMLDNSRAAGAAIRAAGFDTVPAHGDGNASNILLDDSQKITLVDFDMSANMDPFQDLGSFLVEAYAFDPLAQAAFEEFHGQFDEQLFNRTRLYGVADDLRWGLIGAILAEMSTRTDLEFLKYAEWRFLRCRMAMRDPRFEERVRRV
ncbi:MAG: phosphotransferase [Geminicoccales bacterium]